MPRNISKPYKHENSLFKLFGLGVLLPLFGSALSVTVLHGWRMEQIVGHAFLEALGGFTALLVVTLIYANQASTQLKQSEISWIATALLSMGALDFLHAIVPPGNNFVWFHSTATMVGGVFFGGIWLSNILQNKTKLLPLVICVLSIYFATWSLQMPNDVPRMFSSDGTFSLLARFLNIGGGLGFIAGCLYLYKRYQKTNLKDYFLLAVHCLLFGMAGILFELSELWDAAWWWWHVLRFGAYVVLAIFFIRGVLEKIITNKEGKQFSFPKHVLAGATLLTIFAFGWIAHTVFLKSEMLQNIQNISIPAIELSGRIAYIDEVLTTSVYMATMTGEPEWEERYNSNVKKLDLAIKKSIALALEVSSGQSAEQANTAYQKLVEMEMQVFDLINKQKIEEAKSVIFSDAYKEQKKLYSKGMEVFYKRLQESTNTDVEDSIRLSETIEVIISVVLLMLINVWIIVFFNIRAGQVALQNSEAKNKAIVDNTVDGFITFDDKGYIETFNRASERMFGYSIEEVIGKNVKILIHAPYHDKLDGYSHNYHTTGDKQIIGKHREVEGRRKDGCVFPMDLSVSEVGIKGQKLYSGIIRDISDRKQTEEQLSFQAKHDALTGLVNRLEFENRTKRLLSTIQHNKGEHALCYLDLDQFKVINDTCGHAAGDELLRQLGSVLSGIVRHRDTLARLGGDEFGILMEYCSLKQACRVAEALQIAIQEHQFSWEGRNFRVGASIGLVPITTATNSLTELMKNADVACYMAKDMGRNRIQTYHIEHSELVKRHGEMDWVERLNHALEEDRFCLYAQAIVPLDDNKLDKHYELLVRMKDVEGSIILPGAFLPAAERYNLISKLDRWVIENTFYVLSENPTFFNEVDFFSINLSGQSLTDPEILDLIIRQLNESCITSDKICFEITETAAISNLSVAVKFISTLKGLGCRFALDDFGSGLSSFAYLKNLSVDYLKIDGMFVKDIANDPIDNAMVKSINEIGHIIGMQTIAEFVGNDVIKGMLKEIGVDYVQGYGIGKPQPLDELIDGYK